MHQIDGCCVDGFVFCGAEIVFEQASWTDDYWSMYVATPKFL